MMRNGVSLCIAVLGLFVSFASAADGQMDGLLAKLRAVGPNGVGHREATAAWSELARADADKLPEILAGLDGAGPLAANWIRTAVDAIAERQLQQGRTLPAAELEKFVLDKQRDPRARRLAYEWLVRVDASAKDRLIPGMLDDPSWEMRRDAVARLIDQAGRDAQAKRTAEAMVASAFTAPHVSVFHTVDVTKTMRLVERLRADKEFADVRVTPLLIAAKALLLAVRRHPEVNASWVDESQEIVYKHYVNLGIAAQTPRGLIVPNIKDAHRLGLHDLALALADLTAKARSGATTPGDMSDGTITITNVGVFGIDTGTPILNPGESAILAFGAIREQPWVHKGKIRKRYVTQLALSFDHRLVDGGLGSRLLSDVARVLEEPAYGLIWG